MKVQKESFPPEEARALKEWLTHPSADLFRKLLDSMAAGQFVEFVENSINSEHDDDGYAEAAEKCKTELLRIKWTQELLRCVVKGTVELESAKIIT